MPLGDAGAEPHVWSIAAAAVLLEYLLSCHRGDGEAVVGEVEVADLSWWAARLLDAALPEIAETLAPHGARLAAEPRNGGGGTRLQLRLSHGGGPATSEELRQLLADVCAPLEGADLDWLGSLGQSVRGIAEELQALMGSWLDVTALQEVQVQHSVMFNEEWSTPYEICWQADSTGRTIVMPDIPKFGERHFQRFANFMGHRSRGQTVLYQYLGTFVIPCHEVLHIVQGIHGDLLDPDESSYAMEHDASRLNYVLLWCVLQRRSPEPAWSKWVIMLETVNRSAWALGRLRAGGASPSDHGRVYAAYRRWADSFGLESPLAEFRANAAGGEEGALALEGASKCAVAGEGLAVCELPPSQADLEVLLRTAFDPRRRGDVYSAENRALVGASLPERLLRLGDGAAEGLFAKVAGSELEASVAAKLAGAPRAAP